MTQNMGDRTMGETMGNRPVEASPARYIPGRTCDNCGAKGTRTPDPHTASVVRYQLRHSPRFSHLGGVPRVLERSYTTWTRRTKSPAYRGGGTHVRTIDSNTCSMAESFRR